MTPLVVLIQQYSDLSDVNVILTNLNNKVNKVDVYLGEQSIAAVEEAYGEEFSKALVKGMKGLISQLQQAGDNDNADHFQIYVDRLTLGNGLDFSAQKVRDKLDSLATVFGQDVIDSLKRLGYYMISELERTGWTGEPTLEDIQSAINQVLFQRQLDNWYAIAKDVLDSGYRSGKTISEIKSDISGVK